MGAAKRGEAGRYLLTSFDADGRETGVRGLSAHDDAEAIQQAERARWQHEAAGESRLLVLERAEGGQRAVVARFGSRRFEGVREVPERPNGSEGAGADWLTLSEIASSLGVDEETARRAACRHTYMVDRETGERFWSPDDARAIRWAIAQRERRSWIVVSAMDDGRERQDIVNANSAEEAAQAVAASSGVAEVVRVELRKPCR